MPAQKPQLNRSPTPFALQVRLTKAQYAYLLLYADRDGSMGATVRRVIDEAIDATPVVTGPEGDEQESGARLRWVLEHADIDSLDPDELAQLLARDEE